MEWVDSMLGGIAPERKLIILFPHIFQALVGTCSLFYNDLKDTLRFNAAKNRPNENQLYYPPHRLLITCGG